MNSQTIARREQLSRILTPVFGGLALLVPILTALLNSGGDYIGLEVGPGSVHAVSGPFTWRFFQWQIFGGNDDITDFTMRLHDMFGIKPSSAAPWVRLIDIFNPTLFHLFLLFVCAALIARKQRAVSNASLPSTARELKEGENPPGLS